MSGLKVLAIMSVIASFTSFAHAVERPKINLLMLEKELRNCISGQIQTKIDQIQPVHDLSNSIRPPNLELVVVCEPATVEFRDRKGRLTTVRRRLNCGLSRKTSGPETTRQ